MAATNEPENGTRSTAPQSSYSMRQVGIGIAIVLVVLVLIVGLALLV